ncbi:MAG: FMN-binding glutamate synthase family protein [Deltaproteobacteria bacterium]|nr:MAG: FMN-binding glutamate synthase family protein [Deltaproteobacteria bacterium]
MARRIFFLSSAVLVPAATYYAYTWPGGVPWAVFVWFLFLVGVHDVVQRKHTILRNFPVIGHGRYLLEMVRPEMHQYFIESDTNGEPFPRELRSLAYQRAKQVRDTLPFGTRQEVHDPGYEWVEHTLAPPPDVEEHPRVRVGGPDCSKPYEASILNISAMSYGALSSAAILALNGAAKDGGFAHNTGEGGISRYHLEPGGDLVWQIGTGYFGCRTPDGRFDPDKFAEKAALEQVKMIEIKLSQGAKPAHGGILPASKVTPEIAAIRGVEVGKTVYSPPRHTAFEGPKGLLEFVARLRELSGGKPVGFKLCVGRPIEFMAICKAMIETRILPDFVTVDGGEGGTGAAPLEFANWVGAPLYEGLPFVHDMLTGIGVREHVKVFASGRAVTGFHMAIRLALGADVINSARGMMFALGCIQALRCNANTCPTGIATQDPALVAGLHVGDKRARVARYHANTVRALVEIAAAAGCRHPIELRRSMFRRRISRTEVRTLEQIYPSIEPGDLLEEPFPERYDADWRVATAEAFVPPCTDEGRATLLA